MKAALYARVSKAADQTPENQLIALRKWAADRGVQIHGEYVDEVSSRGTRPKKEEVLVLARMGYIDTIAVVSLDRWGRNTTELMVEMDYFIHDGIAFISLREDLDLSSAVGRMYAGFIAIFAGFEREIIRERTNAGLHRAKAWGKALGRHPRDCGCGIPGHNGTTMPIRDAKNVVIGWRYQNGKEIKRLVRNQTPTEKGEEVIP